MNKPRPTTPEEEGIEFHDDATERFQQTVRKVMQGRPVHRTGKQAGADQPKAQDRAGRARPNR